MFKQKLDIPQLQGIEKINWVYVYVYNIEAGLYEFCGKLSYVELYRGGEEGL